MKRSIEEIDALLRELQAQKKAAVRREKQADAEAQAEAQRAIGSLVAEFYGGGWRTVDLPALRALLERTRHLLRQVEELPRDAALKRLRSWRESALEAGAQGEAALVNDGAPQAASTSESTAAAAHSADSELGAASPLP